MNWKMPKDVRADVARLIKAKKEFPKLKIEFPKLKMDTPITILFGSAGSGKTRWAVGIGCGGHGWQYCNARELIDEMRNGCKTDGGVVAREAHLQIAPRLIIDDLADEGDDRFSKRWTSYSPKEIFRRALMQRCRANYRTIITTNIKPERLAERYDHDDPDDPSDRGRIFSRFSDHARIYFFQGDRRKKEEFKYKERTYLDEGQDKEGNPAKRIQLVDRIPALLPIYEVVEDPSDVPDETEADVKKAIKDVDGKETLEVSYMAWLEKGEFKLLIPKEWHERKAARDKEAKLAAEARKREAKKQPAAKAAGGGTGGGSVAPGVQRGADKGAGPGGGASGGDGESGAVDTSDVPDWD